MFWGWSEAVERNGNAADNAKSRLVQVGGGREPGAVGLQAQKPLALPLSSWET